jgi:hypothetical protein
MALIIEAQARRSSKNLQILPMSRSFDMSRSEFLQSIIDLVPSTPTCVEIVRQQSAERIF